MEKFIEIRGARVHNLKNLNVNIPRNKMVVVTGVSGSGKSSLAFDTLYAEGQRRYVESLSAYARQFLERMDKPEVDHIKGISPALAIQQRTIARNPRSTVGTATEIYDFLRLLFARVGEVYCPTCKLLVQQDSVGKVVNRLLKLPPDTRVNILFESDFTPDRVLSLHERGFTRVWSDHSIVSLEEKENVAALLKKGKVDILIDRLSIQRTLKSRLVDSLEIAFREGKGRIKVELENGDTLRFSSDLTCNTCQQTFLEPDPKLFSFNNPYGACEYCQGFGNKIEIDMDLVIPDKTRTLREGAVKPWTTDAYRRYQKMLLENAVSSRLPLDVSVKDLSTEEYDILLQGGTDFKGVREFFSDLERKTYKMHIRVLLSKYRGYVACSDCSGSRLRPEALNVKVSGKTIGEVHAMSISESIGFFSSLRMNKNQEHIARQVLQELNKRLVYLNDVGLSYLNCNRMMGTLSGGETQRISLARSLGSSLVGSLYILDEPSIGLHARDNNKLIGILQNIRNIGNTVVVVEHDKDMMLASDEIIDMGPHAGENGGEIVFQGAYEDIVQSKTSLTGQYLKGKRKIRIPKERRARNGKKITILEACENNLKNINVEIPLGQLVCVTGVSGSGKSTLIHDILFSALAREFGQKGSKIGQHRSISFDKSLAGIEMVDQTPIGRTSRSNPVTYVKIFDDIRKLFAQCPMSKIRGYQPGTFSFNVSGGRCEVCEGTGTMIVDMQFLADIELECEECQGTRYKKEVLEVHYRGKNIHEVLEMTVAESIDFFGKSARIVGKLQILSDVGLGYLHLGQSATTLSGGEAQRIKLASHISNQSRDHTLYLFDEPTTGLHFDDIEKLINCFYRLIENGHSVVIIEHNLDLVKCADWIIDLGPEGGDEGGHVVFAGTPEEIIQSKRSHTGKYLRPYLMTGKTHLKA